MMRLLAFFVVLALPLRAEEFPALHAVTGVASDDVLNIRAEPDAGSEIIGGLAPDATGVEVVGTSGDWALVNTGDGSGYAALRFLAREEGPAWNSLQVPLTCLGTEPFWSLRIDPVARMASFSSPENLDGSVYAIDQQWPAEPWSRTAAVGLSVGTVVLHPLQCSDGMSDRSYGISVDVFFAAPETSRLSGCCRLGMQ